MAPPVCLSISQSPRPQSRVAKNAGGPDRKAQVEVGVTLTLRRFANVFNAEHMRDGRRYLFKGIDVTRSKVVVSGAL